MTDLFKGIKGIKVICDEPLSRHTSFHIGGKARYFVRVFSTKALSKVLSIIHAQKMKYYVLGAGTNVLAGDNGYNGAIIKLSRGFCAWKIQGNIVTCGAGLLLEKFLQKAQEQGFGGAEFLAGIPGTVGGAIKGNAGAFGFSIADIITSIVLMTNMSVRQLDREQMGFGYRRTTIANGSIIMSAKFVLRRRKQESIINSINKNLNIRWQRQPRGYSAGSYFKNAKDYSAGQLIEECGLKGYRIGDAQISMKHGNFIINRGCARATDIIKLAQYVKKRVHRQKGIKLSEEVKLLK